ncbi:MAG TPA: NAD(P)H-hydrate dehydratase, partial [Bacteroidia bacterium]|nr:NAD(P)H-hydrate dehydratase [Bacteroidia bacterium]
NISLIHVGENRVIIDALTGSGMKGEASGNFAKVIDAINNFHVPVVSIDIPSGLHGDDNASNSYAHVVKAKYTLTFQQPKLSFLFSENSEYVGEFHVLNINLHPDFIAGEKTNYYFTVHNEVKNLLSVRGKFSHKGTYGHALVVAGSKGKMGAAVLSVRACLRAGAGLVSTCIPKCGTLIMQTAVPEAMVNESEGEEIISGRIAMGPDKFGTYSAIGIGPGIGKDKATEQAMKLLLNQFSGPLVIDADALNILAENKTWIAFLPKNTILTPHPGEFDRLTQKHSTGFARMKTQKEMALKNGIYIVLKGAYTSIACPDGSVHFNSSGNPGMATGGSGDVLTGIITGLLAQGYSAFDSCLIGVYLHGLAGDIAASVNTENGVIAGDISEQLGGAWKMLSDN